MQEFWESFFYLLLSLSLGFFSLYVDFADFARFRRRVRSSLFASVAGPTWTCEGVFWRVFRSFEPAGHWLEAGEVWTCSSAAGSRTTWSLFGDLGSWFGRYSNLSGSSTDLWVILGWLWEAFRDLIGALGLR
ncbi:uncharacterized protein LOC109704576 isoform X2 [Ananas comosus]|uniref:Uncharacterized protein LOC109704576 isoform X2 n=1 Tax=Ananas comosus TaxID=4615 RepID=A0A6P5EC83_ANACO|nr:uncharacterized protein LOC109704576 isoform X2 [Ananas comosus]